MDPHLGKLFRLAVLILISSLGTSCRDHNPFPILSRFFDDPSTTLESSFLRKIAHRASTAQWEKRASTSHPSLGGCMTWSYGHSPCSSTSSSAKSTLEVHGRSPAAAPSFWWQLPMRTRYAARFRSYTQDTNGCSPSSWILWY